MKRSFGSRRAFAAICSSPVAMAGCSSLCIEDRILPLYRAHVSHEQVNFCWPLPHVAGSPVLRVLSASLTSVRSSSRPHLTGLSDSTSALEPHGSPLFTWNSSVTCRRYEPRKHSWSLTITRSGILPSPLRDKVGYFNPLDFGANYPFTCVSACTFPVYASQ